MKFLRLVLILGVLLVSGATWAQDDEGVQQCTDDEFEETYDLVTEFEIIADMDFIIDLHDTAETAEDIFEIWALLYTLRDTYMLNVTYSLPSCIQAIQFDQGFLRYHSVLISNTNALLLGSLTENDAILAFSTNLDDDMGFYKTSYDLSWFVIELLTDNYSADS